MTNIPIDDGASTPRDTNPDLDRLLDTDGENRAVRAFLLGLRSEAGRSVAAMRSHMKYSGFPHWPQWVADSAPGVHLTKAGAQSWLRHLFGLESTNALDAPLTQAARDVLAERYRQIGVEGWTPEHDNEHDKGELVDAAICYAAGTTDIRRTDGYVWPWDEAWWKPRDPRRNRVIAAALILADLERIDRIASQSALAAHAPVVLPEPEGYVRVPLEFVRRFNTLAHNYSLDAVAPDHYFGTERDAFRNAYARCGRDLAELRALLADVSAPAAPADEVLGWVHKSKSGKIGNHFYTYEPHCDSSVRDDGGEKIAVIAAAAPQAAGADALDATPLATQADALDAARYRWLRRNVGVYRTNDGKGPVSPYLLLRYPALEDIAAETDAAIDAAIAAQAASAKEKS